MKKLSTLILVASALISCDNELDVNAPYKKVSVLYSILDPSLDTNYVRVQRGYLGDAPASASFNNSDSLYYDTSKIEVIINEYDRNSNQIKATYPLVYDNSFELQGGTFTGEGHYVFRTPGNLDVKNENEYEVIVRRKSDNSEASARTGIVGDIRIIRPVEFLQGRKFDGQILFDVRNNGTARIEAFQVIIYFNFREYNMVTGDSTYKTEEIRLPIRANNTGGNIDLLYTSGQLNNTLAGRLEQNPDILRFFIDIELEIWGAAEGLVTYYELNEPSSSINQNRPDFEQVDNGVGLVSSRTRASRPNIDLEPSRFFPNLIKSSATCGLNFVDIRNNGRDTCYCIDGEIYCLP